MAAPRPSLPLIVELLTVVVLSVMQTPPPKPERSARDSAELTLIVERLIVALPRSTASPAHYAYPELEPLWDEPGFQEIQPPKG